MNGRNGYAANSAPVMASRSHPRFLDQNVTGWSPEGFFAPRPTRLRMFSVIPMTATSDLFRRLLSQQPGRPPEENNDEDDEDKDIFPGSADVAGKERFHESQQQPADHGARDVADAAQDGGGERLETVGPAHVEADGTVVHAVHDAGDAAEGRAQSEDEENDDADIDAHQRRSAAVQSSGTYGCAKRRLLDDEPDDQHERK